MIDLKLFLIYPLYVVDKIKYKYYIHILSLKCKLILNFFYNYLGYNIHHYTLVSTSRGILNCCYLVKYYKISVIKLLKKKLKYIWAEDYFKIITI